MISELNRDFLVSVNLVFTDPRRIPAAAATRTIRTDA
jgi:hypothetical protein